MLDLYKNIKEQRLKNNWSQQQLAELVGYKDRTSIAKIESGLFDLSESKISAFAKVFNISPVELMGLDDEYDNLKESESNLTIEEMNVVNKYRKLDLHGRKMVDFTLENEYQRSISNVIVSESEDDEEIDLGASAVIKPYDGPKKDIVNRILREDVEEEFERLNNELTLRGYLGNEDEDKKASKK